ncbi:MAG: hypothetical protein AAB393_08230, partial [Bacteroidota bacterium]
MDKLSFPASTSIALFSLSFFLLIVFWTPPAIAQIDTTLREYFPTHLGNLWEYEEFNPPMSIRYQVRLTGDTLMPNGR